MKKSQERHARILECAARLFASARYDEVLMEDIAREAGVAKGTLYSHFEDKDTLYFAVVFDGIQRLNERLRGVAGEGGNAERRLRAVIGATLSFFTRNRFFFRLLSLEDAKAGGGGSESRQRWQAERGEQIDIIEAILRQGVVDGDFELTHPRLQAHLLRGMVRSLLTSGEDLPADAAAEALASTFLGGVRRASDPPISATSSPE